MIFEYVAVALATTSLVLYGAMMALFVAAMVRRKMKCPADTKLMAVPRVSILKPLAGEDDDLEGNIDSFARLSYPYFEILFGVASSSDAAYSVACSFVSRHPELEARVIVTNANAAINPKVAQLMGLESEATGDICVISDSNVRVSSNYLWSLVRELAEPNVGMVTSLFVGTGEQTLGAAIENMQLCVSSAPGLVAMNAVARRPITVGKSMAMRRVDLSNIGGFRRVGGVLAEDHALGRLMLDAGFTIRTSLETIENRNVVGNMRRSIERHTRWSKMRRAIQPLGFFGEPLLLPIAVSGLGLIFVPERVTGLLFVFSCVVQIGGAIGSLCLLRPKSLSWWHAPLEILRTILVLVCWASAFVGRRIEWRGRTFWVGRGSAIVRASARKVRVPARGPEQVAAPTG